MAGSLLLIATVFTSALWAGFLLRVRPGPLLPPDHGLHNTHILRTLLSIPFMIVAGLIIDWWGVPAAVLLGGSLTAMSFLVFDQANSRWTSIGAVAMLAGGVAALIVASTVLMPLAFFPSYPARSVNLGFLAVFVGSIASRPLMGMLASRLDLRKVLFLLALVSLAPALCVALTHSEEFESVSTLEEDATPLADARLALAALAMLLCWPLEAAMAPWARRYVGELDFHPGAALLVGVGFWLAFIGSRLAAGIGFPASSEAVWVVVLAVVAGITAGNMLSGYGRRVTVIGVWVLGACAGPLVPTLLGLALRTFPDNPGTAVGIVGAAGTLGAALLTPLIDVTDPQRPSKVAMRGAIVLGVLIFAPALVLAIVG